MLLWKTLVEAAKSSGIDRHRAKARAWIHKHLPELLRTPADAQGNPYRESGRVVREEAFDWQEEWPKWQRCLRALRWLADRKDKPARPRSAEDRIPLDVQQPVDETLGRVRLGTSSDYASENKTCVRFSGGAEAAKRFSSLDEFWEAVFVSFYLPDMLPQGSVCSACGAALAKTKRKGKVSKAKLCAACRLRTWRQSHPDRARELWRDAKRKERLPRRANRT
jgi:hypothetical protein